MLVDLLLRNYTNTHVCLKLGVRWCLVCGLINRVEITQDVLLVAVVESTHHLIQVDALDARDLLIVYPVLDLLDQSLLDFSGVG